MKVTLLRNLRSGDFEAVELEALIVCRVFVIDEALKVYRVLAISEALIARCELAINDKMLCSQGRGLTASELYVEQKLATNDLLLDKR